jgi:hypothetical protein
VSWLRGRSSSTRSQSRRRKNDGPHNASQARHAAPDETGLNESAAFEPDTGERAIPPEKYVAIRPNTARFYGRRWFWSRLHIFYGISLRAR